MPDKIENIVQRMIDAGESEEDIASVIKEYNFKYPVVKQEVLRDTYKGPTTFSGGVLKSLMGGEAGNASLQGLKGYAQGAIGDLPSSVMNTLGTIGNFAWNPSGTLVDAVKGIPQGLRNIYQTASMAGYKPEEFGRMSGQITGQPLVTASIAKAVPTVVGVPLENIGRVMGESQPLSGIMPRFARMRTLKLAEKTLGPKLERYGGMISGRTPKSGIPGTTRAFAIPMNEPRSITLNPKPGFDWTTPESNYYEGSRGYTVNEPQQVTINPPAEERWQMPENVTQSDVPLGIDKTIPTQTLDMRAQPTTNWLGYTDVAQPTGIDWARLRRIFDLKKD